jgi:hypothetical protein
LLQKIFSRWRIEDIRYCNDNGEEQNPHALNHWQRMIAAQNQQKNYADKRYRELAFEAKDQAFLKVSSMKGIVRFNKKGKSSPRFVGSFDIIGRIGSVVYRELYYLYVW